MYLLEVLLCKFKPLQIPNLVQHLTIDVKYTKLTWMTLIRNNFHHNESISFGFTQELVLDYTMQDAL
jgi:hypothetical protein